jgi:SAM-dependent methyltransferase
MDRLDIAVIREIMSVRLPGLIRRPLWQIRRMKRWLDRAEFVDIALDNEARLRRWLDNSQFIEDALDTKKQREKEEQAFSEQFATFELLSTEAGRLMPLRWEDRYPCLNDKTPTSSFDRHYIYHPAWASRILSKTRPSRHVDISSSLHFCSLVSAFVPVDFYDYRPAELFLPGLNCGKADLLQLPFPSASIESLSCMHVLEHIGLGRYGDQHDPNGDLKAIRELCRVLSKGGNLLVVVPVGRSRIMFNAHRIYDFQDFRDYFKPLNLVEFALISGDNSTGGLLYNPAAELVNKQEYGCGCYWFQK